MQQNRVSGFFNGTAAAMWVCIGFVPDYVRLWVPDAAAYGARAYWNINFLDPEAVEGIGMDFAALESDGDITTHEYLVTEGIRPYYGGDKVQSDSSSAEAYQASVTYGESTVITWDDIDYRYGSGKGPHPYQDGVSDTIDTWTLGNATNRTGNFNEDVTGTYIGPGSRIRIDGRWYVILALTAGQGKAANEVTLNYAAPSGAVEFIRGMKGMRGIPIGNVAPAGFKLNLTSVFNVNDEKVVFEAGTFDRV